MNLIHKQRTFFPSLIDNYFNQEWDLNIPNYNSLPAVNLRELDTQFDIHLAVPGMKKATLKLKLITVYSQFLLQLTIKKLPKKNSLVMNLVLIVLKELLLFLTVSIQQKLTHVIRMVYFNLHYLNEKKLYHSLKS